MNLKHVYVLYTCEKSLCFHHSVKRKWCMKRDSKIPSCFFFFLMLKYHFFTEESIPRTQVDRRKTSPYFSSKYSKEGTIFFVEINLFF